MKIVQDELQFCEDCLIAAVNGDFTGLDYHYSSRVVCMDCNRDWKKSPWAEFCPNCESTDIRPMAEVRQEQITAGLERLGANLVPNHDSETGKGIDEFSRSPCACCGTRLGGSRHEFAILGE